jgi:UDP-N-acetylglucosamine 1-carboxyvinyltransferase
VTVELDHENDRIIVPQEQDLKIVSKVKWTPFDLKALQRPLYPADLIHVAVVLGLKSDGQAIFHNLMYEYGFFFVQELAKMKANVIMWNPFTLITSGPTVFRPANLVCSDIIQASYGLLLAGLSAEWTTTLNAITPLFRRFPNFVEQFNRLGADITLED